MQVNRTTARKHFTLRLKTVLPLNHRQGAQMGSAKNSKNRLVVFSAALLLSSLRSSQPTRAISMQTAKFCDDF